MKSLACLKRWKRGLIRLSIASSVIMVWILWSIFQTREERTNLRLGRRLLNSENTTSTIATTTINTNYPPAIFTDDQLKQGAIILHVIGIVYTFVALAIVCDEFFVPALNVITEKLGISEDVAGATFMAAGGSAPELFTSLIGVFTDNTAVGVGTIVGSAVFNILFVIGMCAMFSSHVLNLTWWPLFRDVTFYSIDLIVLMVVFYDSKVMWYEALILLILYIFYVTFMAFNEKIETFIKGKLKKNQVETVHTSDILISDKLKRSCSLPVLHSGSGRFRHGVLQLMIHTIDPLSEGRVHEKASHLQAVTGSRIALGTPPYSNDTSGSSLNQDAYGRPVREATVPTISNGTHSHGNGHGRHVTLNLGSQRTLSSDLDTDTSATASPNVNNNVTTHGNGNVARSPDDVNGHHGNGGHHHEDNGVVVVTNGSAHTAHTAQTAHGRPESSESQRVIVTNVVTQRRMSIGPPKGGHVTSEAEEPLDMSWPSTHLSRLTYILLFPIIFPMWLSCPDVRRPERKKFFIVTFVMAILWIGGYSYLMVWWADVTGRIAGIPIDIMGMTFLAAGTSIPDLITSVIVAKKGFGDMAVSSSVGSNIFDVTMGLPVPWLLYIAIFQKDVSVDSDGMFCLVALLLIMLVIVLASIAKSGWKMTKILGMCMFVLYAVFITLALLLTLPGYLSCPFHS